MIVEAHSSLKCVWRTESPEEVDDDDAAADDDAKLHSVTDLMFAKNCKSVQKKVLVYAALRQ